MKQRASLDYITRDYEGFRQLMIDLIPTITPEWTDNSSSDMGMVLLELTAHGLDILSYYLDKVYNEGNLTTAQTRESVMNICRMLGYTLDYQTPAVHELTITKSSDYFDKRIVIPKGTKFGTDPDIGEQIIFETNEDLVLEALEESGGVTKTVQVTHGETMLDTGVGKIKGAINEQFTLTYPDVLLDTLVVTTQLGGTVTTWEVVTDFFNSSANDRHVMAEYDADNKVTLTFGDGVLGVKPFVDSTIHAIYRVGGGAIGNVGLNTINSFVDSEIAGINFTNSTPIVTYGLDVESLDHAKKHAPRAYKTMDRAVTVADFESVVCSVRGVSKAQCIETFNYDGDLHIYVVPDSYLNPTETLKKEIMDKLNSVKLVHDNPILKDPTYVPLNITVNVTTNPTKTNEVLKNTIKEKIKSVFDIEHMEIQEGLNVASIFREVMTVSGVDNLTVTQPSQDITLTEGQILKLTDVTVNVTGGV